MRQNRNMIDAGDDVLAHTVRGVWIGNRDASQNCVSADCKNGRAVCAKMRDGRVLIGRKDASGKVVGVYTYRLSGRIRVRLRPDLDPTRARWAAGEWRKRGAVVIR